MATNSQADRVFVPAKAFSHNEKDWAAEIGLLPWDSHIVFTKESLIRFLKTLEVEVGTSMSEVRKLPKFAQVGSMKEPTSATTKPTSSAEPALPTPPRSTPSSAASKAHSVSPPRTATDASPPVVVTASGEAFRPTRKVRELPGGGSAQIASLFGNPDDDDDGADHRPVVPPAPSKRSQGAQEDVSPLRERSVLHQHQAEPKPAPAPESEAKAGSQNVVVMPDGSAFVPSRKVREPVGGFSSMAALLSGE